MECVEKYLEPGQGWLSRLSSKEVCVGLMWAASTDQLEVLERLMEVETIFSLRSSLAPLGYVKIKTIRLLGTVVSLFSLLKHIPHIRGLETQFTRLGLGGYWVDR